MNWKWVLHLEIRWWSWLSEDDESEKMAEAETSGEVSAGAWVDDENDGEASTGAWVDDEDDEREEEERIDDSDEEERIDDSDEEDDKEDEAEVETGLLLLEGAIAAAEVIV